MPRLALDVCLVDTIRWGRLTLPVPGVREAIEEGRYGEAEAQVVLVAGALQDEAAWIEQICKELEN
jgi:hypothetical protein